MRKIFTAKNIAVCAIVAALYVILTLVAFPIAYTPIQIRPSEALTMLPTVFPISSVGLFVGCMIANIASPFGLYDILLGSTISLVAGILTFVIFKLVKVKYLNYLFAGLPPVLLNAIFLPLIWYFLFGDAAYWMNFISILATQAIMVYVLGIPLAVFLKKTTWSR